MKIKHIILTGLAGILLFGTVQAQEQPTLRQRADDLFARMEYAKALSIYERLVQAKHPKVADIERVAQGYLYLNEYKQAETWYARAIQTEEHTHEALLGYAEALKQNGKYADAKQQFLEYAAKYDDSEKIQREIAGCDSAMVWMANPLPYHLRNESEVNTDLSEFAAIPTTNGAIYVAEPKIGGSKSGMTGQAYLKVFSASRNAEQLTLPNIMPYSFNNTPYHVGPVVPNKDEDVLYVTRTHPGKQVQRYKEGGTRFKKHNLELKIYRNNGNDWAEEDFPYNNVEQYSVGHAALSDDEETLYFASDMPGGYGGVDLWYCIKTEDGGWGAPVNAGNVVNSAGDEMFPTVYGDTLYYSSDGFPGMGGLDIFMAEGNRSDFKNRRNLQYPINSASDDFSFVVMADDDDAFYGYISSNRPGGIGSDDIYSFNFAKPKIRIVLQGMVYDKKTNLPLDASRLSLIGEEDGNVIAQQVSNADGTFEFDLTKGKAFKVTAEHVGYMGDSTHIVAVTPKQDTTIRVNLYLAPLKEKGDKIVLENLYYDFDKYNIRPDAALVLDHVVKVMRDNPTLKIELSSHTDSRGSDSYNMKLSQRRAQSAVEYIISRGISADRLVAKGYGETRLINRCANSVKCTEEEHQANRRTEIEVIDF